MKGWSFQGLFVTPGHFAALAKLGARREQILDPWVPEYRRTGDESLWAVVAITGRIVRIAEVFPGHAQALKDQIWRETQVRAYAGFLERTGQPAPRYTIRPIRRTDLPKRWKPLPALGFLHGNG